MKYYSEKLDKLFDSQEQLEAEETKASKKKPKKVEPNTDVNTVPEVPSRKELAQAVELADAAVSDAYANYESAKIKAQELSKKYIEEIASIITPAEQAIKDAEQTRYAAIKKFNESYGAYQVTYTGAKAASEMIKAINNINKNTNNLVRDFFWF